jgi:hypothetical protein
VFASSGSDVVSVDRSTSIATTFACGFSNPVGLAFGPARSGAGTSLYVSQTGPSITANDGDAIFEIAGPGFETGVIGGAPCGPAPYDAGFEADAAEPDALPADAGELDAAEADAGAADAEEDGGAEDQGVDGGVPPDAGDVDGGVDSGGPLDSGALADAGAEVDAGRDAGAPPDASRPDAAMASDAGITVDEDGGCGCTTSAKGGSGSSLGLLLIVMLCAMRARPNARD